MRHIIAAWAGILWLVSLLAGVAAGQERRDVTFTTPFPPGQRPTSADFYYNDRAIGSGREAFEEILKRISELPEGTSIVWGPNYERCGSCSGREPSCLPKHLYPDLWKQLNEIVAERKLTLSSGYPTPWSHSTQRSSRHEFPKQVFADRAPESESFDAVLDWEVGQESGFVVTRDPEKGTEYAAGRRHRFSSNKTNVAGYDLRLFFDRLPENSRVLVRLTLQNRVLKSNEATITTALVEDITQAWYALLASNLRRGHLRAAIVVPASLAKSFEERRSVERLSIDWQNYHGPNTPHEEVLYFANDMYLGRGDVGLDQIMDRIDRLPAGAGVTLPRYELGGRAVSESLSSEEIASRNATVNNLVPFPKRKREFDLKLGVRKLELHFDRNQPGGDDGTVLSWHSGDRNAQTMASFGRIIHHTEARQRPAARLGWVRYDATDKDERKLETTACYTVDDAEVGEGVGGFAKAMQQLAALPAGSVVQVRVCLRTKGRFTCPLIYEGQRHFERTGFEPYCGMLRWLVDVAEKRKLQIEWLPDEAESCGDCELNK